MAAGSSNFRDASARIEDLEFLYASNVNVSNFVSVKLSSDRNYHIWKTQMLCLLKSHKMGGMVDEALASPRTSSIEMMEQYHSLVKGWIFGSVSEDVLGTIVDLDSAKDVWNKLKSIYDPASQEDSAATKWGSEIETNETDVVSTETDINGQDTVAIEVIGEAEDICLIETETEGEDTEILRKREKKIENKKKLREATVKGNWVKVESILKEDEELAREAISSDGSTVLHLAVGTGHNDLVKKIFSYIKVEDLLAARNSDGCTTLHIAAIVGNKYAADLLVNKNSVLLRMKDHKGEEPLHKACENMHLDTIGYLLKAVNDDPKSKLHVGDSGHPGVKIGVDLLVNAISAKEYSKQPIYHIHRMTKRQIALEDSNFIDLNINILLLMLADLASELVRIFPKFASKNDDVLMAIAQTFPDGLNHLETLMYPSLDSTSKLLGFTALVVIFLLIWVPMFIFELFREEQASKIDLIGQLIISLLLTVPSMFMSVIILAILLIMMVWFLFLVLYWLLWKGAKILFAPIKHIENKKKEWNEATKVLELVCDEIDELKFSGTHHPYYTRSILEASCQNAYKVVDEILFRSHEAIQSRNKSGYDIIQLAIINRSENIYNLIYEIGERKNLYRTVEDSSKNNILHLAGRLAPSHELNKRRGAALQLQRELQWREEVRKHIFPTYITRQNIFGETPDMVFTREHENLVKEGEKWMKTTAESCSITAALITTIVFAAAITVPGGSNQQTGIPLFTENGAFTVFAVSDAISLFASSTALLVFLSILTARFSENDFLVSLPRRLLIGLCTLFLSTVAMMVAFSATLFLVFCDRKLWMLAPICVSAFIPIGFFVNLQFPLIVDLFRSTYLPVFGKERKSLLDLIWSIYFPLFGEERKSLLKRFNPDDIRLYFAR